MRRALPVVLLLAVPAAAHAAKYSHGVYAEAGLGATGWLGDAQKYAAPGPDFALRVGTDLTSWFSVGGLLAGSVHEATVPPPPEQEYFQLYRIAADGRLTIRAGRFAFFGEGALGFGIVSTNVLDKVDVTPPDSHTGVALSAGGGIDYHTQNRHFSFGLAGDYTVLTIDTDHAAQAVSVRLYLRYTR